MSACNLYLETGEVQAYAIRRVNPFIGVLQVIETEDGRAISSNGVVWEIELRTERSGMWGSLNKHAKEAVYYRFGLWSAEDGLVKRPLAPHLTPGPPDPRCRKGPEPLGTVPGLPGKGIFGCLEGKWPLLRIGVMPAVSFLRPFSKHWISLGVSDAARCGTGRPAAAVG